MGLGEQPAFQSIQPGNSRSQIPATRLAKEQENLSPFPSPPIVGNVKHEIRIGLPEATCETQNLERCTGLLFDTRSEFRKIDIIYRVDNFKKKRSDMGREGFGSRWCRREQKELSSIVGKRVTRQLDKEMSAYGQRYTYVHSRCKWFSKDEPGGCTTFTISTGLACRRGAAHRSIERRTYAYPQGRRESLCNTFTIAITHYAIPSVYIEPRRDPTTRTHARTLADNREYARTLIKPVIIINRSNTVSRSLLLASNE